MRRIAAPFLSLALKGPMAQYFEAPKPIEVDPQRVCPMLVCTANIVSVALVLHQRLAYVGEPCRCVAQCAEFAKHNACVL